MFRLLDCAAIAEIPCVELDAFRDYLEERASKTTASGLDWKSVEEARGVPIVIDLAEISIRSFQIVSDTCNSRVVDPVDTVRRSR